MNRKVRIRGGGGQVWGHVDGTNMEDERNLPCSVAGVAIVRAGRTPCHKASETPTRLNVDLQSMCLESEDEGREKKAGADDLGPAWPSRGQRETTEFTREADAIR